MCRLTGSPSGVPLACAPLRCSKASRSSRSAFVSAASQSLLSMIEIPAVMIITDVIIIVFAVSFNFRVHGIV
jgi:hypothetical protein